MSALVVQVPVADRREAGLSERLAETSRAVGQVLDEVRFCPDEARRFVTRDLGFEPRPDVLRAIVRIALDRSATGPQRDLSRRLLTLHVMVDHEVTDLLESTRLDPDRIRRSSRHLPDLLRAARDVEADAASLIDATSGADRDFLVEVVDALCLPEEELVTAAVLTPRIGLLLDESNAGTAGSEPSPGEAGPPAGPSGAAGVNVTVSSGRAVLNAVVLCSLIDEDLGRFADIRREPRRDRSGKAREATLDRLRRNAVAYRVVSERLRDQQTVAILAGLEAFVDEIGKARGRLFAAHLKLSAALRA